MQKKNKKSPRGMMGKPKATRGGGSYSKPMKGGVSGPRRGTGRKSSSKRKY